MACNYSFVVFVPSLCQFLMASARSDSVRSTATSVRVFARVRPFAADEDPAAAAPFTVNANTIDVVSEGPSSAVGGGSAPRRVVKSYPFDMCFSGAQRGSQRDVYAHVAAPLLESAMGGVNACLMAYGQTGSGKTFTKPHGSSKALNRA